MCAYKSVSSCPGVSTVVDFTLSLVDGPLLSDYLCCRSDAVGAMGGVVHFKILTVSGTKKTHFAFVRHRAVATCTLYSLLAIPI